MTLLDVMHVVMALFLPLAVYYIRSDRRKGLPFSSFTVRNYGMLAVGVLGVAIVVLRLAGIYSPSS